MNLPFTSNKTVLKWTVLLISLLGICYSLTKIQVHIDCLGCTQNPATPKQINKETIVNNDKVTTLDVLAASTNNANSVVMCPKFILPVLPALPKLPPKEVLVTLDKDQLNAVLYQHVRSHQERLLNARKILYTSYGEYLKSCN